MNGIPTNLARLSRVMAWLSTAGFFITPAVLTYIFLEPDKSHWLMLNVDHMGDLLYGTIPPQYRMLALASAMIPAGFNMWALWSLRRLFLLYAQGAVFSAGAMRALNAVAIALFAGEIVSVFAQAPMSLALTWANGPHHREICLSFGSEDVAALFMAGVVLVIARVMAEARRMADENAAFV